MRPSKRWVDGGTHLIIPQVRLTPQVVTALASAAHLVTMSYLEDLIRHVELPPSQPGSLETSFEPPDPRAHLPPSAIEGEDMTPQQFQTLMARNTERRNFFVGATGLFIFQGEQPDEKCRLTIDLFALCGGKVDLLSFTQANFSSPTEAQRTLRPFKTSALSHYHACGEAAKHAPDGGLVVLVHEDELLPRDERYNNLRLATRSMDIRMSVQGTTAVAEAIIYNDPRAKMNATAADPASDTQASPSMDPLNSTVDQPPSRLPEASLPPPTGATTGSVMSPTQRIQQEFASASPSQVPPPTAPAPDPEPQHQPQPEPEPEPSSAPNRRKRKAAGPKINAFDQVFGDLPSVGQSSQEPPLAPPPDATPASASNNDTAEPSAGYHLSGPQLKRRGGTQRQSRISELFAPSSTQSGGGVPGSQSVLATGGESGRLTKRYRALLEEEDLRASQGGEASSAQSSADKERAVAAGQQRPQQGNAANVTGKRSTREEEASPPPPKRAALQPSQDNHAVGKQSQSVRARQASPPPSKQPSSGIIRSGSGPRGKAPGQAPDTEPELLQALATHRRGKKNAMDDFDKEFNSLRLVKPTLDKSQGRQAKTLGQAPIEEDEDYQAWKAAAIEDFAIPVGNFVQVDYVPLVRSRPNTRSSSSSHTKHSDHPEWSDRPNFKKFKAKSRPERKPVLMDLTEPQDFGMGSEYLPNPAADIRLSADPAAGEEGDDRLSQRANFASRNLGRDEEDDIDMQLDSGRPKSSRSGSNARKTSGGQRSNILKALAESDDEDDAAAQASLARSRRARRGRNDDEDDGGDPLPSSRQRRQRLPALDDDLSDGDDSQGAAYESTGRRRGAAGADDTSIDLRLSRNVEDADLSMPAARAGSRRQAATARSNRGMRAAAADADDSEEDDGRGGATPSTMSRGTTSANASQSTRMGVVAQMSTASRSSNARKRPASMLTDPADDDDDGADDGPSRRNTNDAQDVRLRPSGTRMDEDDDEEGVFKGFKGTQSSRRSTTAASRARGGAGMGASQTTTRSSAKRSRI